MIQIIIQQKEVMAIIHRDVQIIFSHFDAINLCWFSADAEPQSNLSQCTFGIEKAWIKISPK